MRTKNEFTFIIRTEMYLFVSQCTLIMTNATYFQQLWKQVFSFGKNKRDDKIKGL